MDAFEQLVADLFWAEGYWVRTGVKVELTREDKQRIALPSCPRWEIDIVAYKPAAGELLALECKSYLDSGGVHARHFDPNAKLAGRYKLFNQPVLREVVLARLHDQLGAEGRLSADGIPRLGLVYGLASPSSEQRLREHFGRNGWLLFGPDWIKQRLHAAARSGYENNAAAMVAKLLLGKCPVAAGAAA